VEVFCCDFAEVRQLVEQTRRLKGVSMAKIAKLNAMILPRAGKGPNIVLQSRSGRASKGPEQSWNEKQ
jgi:hypothetical protein